jgi:predicted DCC family thiol-disulfide oxidoreductase YuxK
LRDYRPQNAILTAEICSSLLQIAIRDPRGCEQLENESSMRTNESPSAVILYDGECGLCDRLVQWVLPRDRRGRFQFAALQSDWAQAALRRHHRPTKDFDTMVLVEGDRIFLRSTAALRVLRGLPGWRWAYVFIIVPRSIRDAVYGWIAARRKRWFPAPDACGIPKAEWRGRFIAG